MDIEKKPKRPRISSAATGHYEKVNYSPANMPKPEDPSTTTDATESERKTYNNYPRDNYQRRDDNQNGYHQRPYGNSYQQRNAGRYQQRPGSNFNRRPAYDVDENVEGYEARPQYQRRDDNQNGYQPRQGGYQQRNDYNHQNGYQPRQGGYQQRNGYNRQNGYQPRQGGYQQRQGDYNRQGGYQQQRPGGYQQRNDYNRQGGYQQRPGGYQKRQGGFQQRPGTKFTPRPKQIDYVFDPVDPNSEMRLNKFMSNAGVCSRREADEKIIAGAVMVNGKPVTELGFKIKPADVVEFDGKVVVPERKCYVLLNKPKDCVTTCDDPGGRTTVMEIVKNACKERIYPVGRLDRNTTGVLLLTNDGDLASKLTHPKFVKKKIYHVWTDKDIAEDDMQRLADGIELDDGEIHADEVSYVSETDRNQAGIEIHSGKNRIVRRMFEALGYRVVKLDRVYFAGLTKKNLPRGRWRYLTQEEVNFLRMGSFE